MKIDFTNTIVIDVMRDKGKPLNSLIKRTKINRMMALVVGILLIPLILTWVLVALPDFLLGLLLALILLILFVYCIFIATTNSNEKLEDRDSFKIVKNLCQVHKDIAEYCSLKPKDEPLTVAEAQSFLSFDSAFKLREKERVNQIMLTKLNSDIKTYSKCTKHSHD